MDINTLTVFGKEREQVDRKTIFVVVGDHGDLLGEHGLAGHKLVVDALTHVPLITHGLNGVSAP